MGGQQPANRGSVYLMTDIIDVMSVILSKHKCRLLAMGKEVYMERMSRRNDFVNLRIFIYI